MMPLIDDVLRYHVRLDGLVLATMREIVTDIDAALAKLKNELARRLPADAPFTNQRLFALHGELAALRLALAQRLAWAVSESLDAVMETAGPATAAALKSFTSGLPGDSAARLAIEARFTEVPVAMLANVKSATWDGETWTRWGTKLAEDTLSRLASELRQAAALGETWRETGKRFATVASLSRASAEKLARTAINATANRARVEASRRMAGDIIKGWRFVATLDSKTSAVCRGLDGREFGCDDPNIPKPPRHPNCRSVIVPVTKTFRELGIDLPEPPQGERPAVRDGRATQVPASTAYADWFARQPAAFQREVLGDTRYRAYRRGVPLEGMATYDRPLTVNELRRLYPQEMAGVA